MYISFIPEYSNPELAFLIKTSDDIEGNSLSLQGLKKLRCAGLESGYAAFWRALDKILAKKNIRYVAISLNPGCVYDDEVLKRVSLACEAAAGGVKWAVIGSIGKSINGITASVVYSSEDPRLFYIDIPLPIVDCGLDLFVLNADFLRGIYSDWNNISMDEESFPQWCILQGYIRGWISIYRPELAIGVLGYTAARDYSRHLSLIRRAFGGHLSDESIPSLMGDLPLKGDDEVGGGGASHVRRDSECSLSGNVKSLTERVRELSLHVSDPMSLSIITRTRFSRKYLLRRMLSSITRARHNLPINIEIILSTDIDINEAKEHTEKLRLEFPELNIILQNNKNDYKKLYSRVKNLIGGIMAAHNDYIVIVDDDDFLDIEALINISDVRFLGGNPLLVMSSQVRKEKWVEVEDDNWIIESSEYVKDYNGENIRNMFTGINHLPICALIMPRNFLQKRIQELVLRHNLSEDYTIYLGLLSAPDLPTILIYPYVFCIISIRDDGSNTITMRDRRPWVRDITLFLHDLLIAHPAQGAGIARMLGQMAIKSQQDLSGIVNKNKASWFDQQRQIREVALLKAEIDYLRSILEKNLIQKREGGQK